MRTHCLFNDATPRRVRYHQLDPYQWYLDRVKSRRILTGLIGLVFLLGESYILFHLVRIIWSSVWYEKLLGLGVTYFQFQAGYWVLESIDEYFWRRDLAAARKIMSHQKVQELKNRIENPMDWDGWGCLCF